MQTSPTDCCHHLGIAFQNDLLIHKCFQRETCYRLAFYVGCLCSPRYKMGAVCSSLYPQMRIFQLLTRFRCIKFSFLLKRIFLSPIVLIVFNKNGPIRMQYLSVLVRRDRRGVNYYCDYSGPSGLSVELKRLDFSGVAILF